MKKIVIIGGGIAGLSAGIFAQKNGFDSVILEKHHTLGASVPDGTARGIILTDVSTGWWAQRKARPSEISGMKWEHWTGWKSIILKALWLWKVMVSRFIFIGILTD
mgnify:CR=1 FL=1